MSRAFLVPVLLPADPAAALEAATKQYVDNKAVGGAGAFFQYTFSTATAAPPATGSIRYNNATPASVTTLWVHFMTNDSTDTKTRMLQRRAGDKLYLQDKDSSATWHIYRLTATPTDNTTYATLTVVWDSGAGTFGNNQLLLVGFLTNTIPDGDKGDITTSSGGATWTIDDNAVTNADLADVATATIKGRTTAGTGDPEDLTGAQATALLSTFGTTTKGLVPAPGTATGEFLKDDGTWDVPAGGGGGSVSGTKLTALVAITAAGIDGLYTDIIEVVDVSDTTMSASGTNKKMTFNELLTWMQANLVARDVATDTIYSNMIVNDQVTNVDLANMAANTIKGNNTGSSADPLDLTVAQTQLLLDLSGTSQYYRYTFSTTTTAPPAAGTIRLNNATIVLATAIYVPSAPLDSSGINARTKLLNRAVGERLLIQSATGLASYYLTAAPIDQGTYIEFTVGFGSGSGSITDVQAVTFGSMGTGNAPGGETRPGLVELATAAETLTGTDNTRAVHPLGLAPLVSGGGPLFGFLFDTTTTAGASINGLRINNATPASATAVYVNYTPREGVDLKTRLLAGTAGDRLYIQDRANSANYRVYELTGAPTDNTTYATVTVVHRGGGGSLWANGAAIVAGFTAPPITVGTTAPSSPLTNDLWVDTN